MKLRNNIKLILLVSGLSCTVVPASAVSPQNIKIENSVVIPVNDKMRFSADIVLDSLKLGANKQIYLTPVIEDGNGNSEVLPSALINGRSMQIAWNRGTVESSQKYTNGIKVVEKRRNGKPQSIPYDVSVPMQQWMWSPSAGVKWMAHFSASIPLRR